MQTLTRNERTSHTATLVVLALLLLLAGLLWRHAGDLDAYRRYWLDEQPAMRLRFDELNATMDEAALQKQVAGVALRCISEPRERNTLGDRVCWADIHRLDDTPAMQFAAFFDQGRLVYIKVDVPWWAHHAALRQVVAQFGAPEAIDEATVASPVVQWRTRSGRLKLEQAPGYDPLRSVALQWRADAAAASPPKAANPPAVP